MLGLPLGRDNVKRRMICQQDWLFMQISHIQIYTEHCLWPQLYSHWHCSIVHPETLQNFGDQWHTFPIYCMEKVHLIKLLHEIKSKMSTIVFHLLFSHWRRFTMRMDLIVLCWIILCESKYGYIFIGDTEGNNKWLAQYPGNKEGVKQPYRDCNCQYDALSNPNPICT